MASSALAIIRETRRQILTGDSKFYKKLVYFFELRVPASLGALGTDFLFPLALNPQEITMEEPFTIETQPTQGGGLYVEENGIVQRTLRIRGTTGFKPRKLEATAGLGYVPYPGKRSFGRDIMPVILDELSGQRHMQWLQDKVFRAYGDLKRDPTTSLGTKLFFHNQKDDEHWLVAPQAFTLSRTATRSTLYEYSIDLLILDAAEAETLTLSEDRGIFDRIRDVLRRIADALNMISGAIQDITAVVGELRQIVAGIDTVLDSVSNIVTSLTAFVNGTAALITSPLAFVQSTIEFIENTNVLMETMEGTAQAIPASIRNSFRQLQDSLEVVASYPSAFQKPVDVAVADAISRQQLSTNTSSAELALASSTAPTTLDGFRNLGTGLMPGDAARAEVSDRTGSAVPSYTSVKQQQLQQGDTLASLAARYLGDARLWKNIAILNGLQPPFVSDLEVRDLTRGAPFPGTLGRGQTILVPSRAPAPTAQPTLTTYGVMPEEANEVHLLGTDLLLTSSDGGRTFDIPIDVEGGSVDAKRVSGIGNLTQAIQTRLTTEQGHDLLYRYVGIKRVVGLGSTITDSESAQFRVVEAVTTDPRIAGLRRAEFLGSNADAMALDLTVEVRGFAETAQIKLEVA
jgi:hypothetical protein